MTSYIEDFVGTSGVMFGLSIYSDDQDSILCADVAFYGHAEVFVLEDYGSVAEMDSEDIDNYIRDWRALALKVRAGFKVDENILALGDPNDR